MSMEMRVVLGWMLPLVLFAVAVILVFRPGLRGRWWLVGYLGVTGMAISIRMIPATVFAFEMRVHLPLWMMDPGSAFDAVLIVVKVLATGLLVVCCVCGVEWWAGCGDAESC